MVLGFVGLVAYKDTSAKHPIARVLHINISRLIVCNVCSTLITTRTGLSRYLQTTIMPIVILTINYYQQGPDKFECV